MNKIGLFVTAVFLVFASAPSLEAADATMGQKQALVAQNLFLKACIPYMSEPNDVPAMLDKTMTHQPPEVAKTFMKMALSPEGNAWTANIKDVGQFVVLLEDKGACTVIPKEADQNEMHELAKNLVKRLQVGETADSGKAVYSFVQPDPETRISTITVTAAGQPNALLFTTTTKARNVNVGGILRAYRVAK